MKKNLFQLALTWLLIMVSHSALALSSIVTIEGHVEAWGRASNYSTQKEADKVAIETCQEAANKHGISNLAKQCKVVTRAKGPGYGAVACGDNECWWTMGYDTAQEAVDRAYDGCAKHYTNCKDKDISYWEDFAGFTPPPSQNTANNDCRPHSSSLSCSSSCSNGNCVMTYENGCKIRVQVQPRFNGMTNTWEYPAPSC